MANSKEVLGICDHRNHQPADSGKPTEPSELPPRPETYQDRHAVRIKPAEDATSVRYIESLEATISRLQQENERLKKVEEFVECTGRARAVLDRAKAAEAQLAAYQQAEREQSDRVKAACDEII
jgi:hypothetical protein